MALPFFASQATNFLAQLSVVAILGRMGQDAVYVRSLYQPISYLLLALTVAFAVTHQAAAATSRGRRRPDEVMAHAAALARIWLTCVTVICVALAAAAPWLADVLDVAPGIRPVFVSFLRWTSIVGVLGIGPELCAASLRGHNHARLATVLTLCTATLQVGCVAGLGLGTGIGVSAVPLGQGAAAIGGLAVGCGMLRRTELWHPRAAAPRALDDAFSGLRRIGLPVAASLLVISGYNFAVLAVLTRYGADTVAGFSVAMTLQNFVLLPGTVIGTATAIVINQQRGAGEGSRAYDSLRGGLEVSAMVYVVIAVGLWSVAHPVAHLLSSEASVSAVAGSYLSTVGLTYVFQGPVLAALTALEETGAGVRAILLNVIYFGVIVLASSTLADSLGGAVGFFDIVAYCNFMGIAVPVYALWHMRRTTPRKSG
ncbi:MULTISPECIES: MATE family efflux transporter [unclassified Streptomyces]|uniref:MATE family efflux transporter n=1 Tax=unclassified Streptomyces TaxID=2593676 RepID=UPI0036E139CE